MNHGSRPYPSFIAWQSSQSIEATFSDNERTCAQTKTFFTKPEMRGTCWNRELRESFIAPLRSQFNLETPWQGGPDPTITNPTEGNFIAHCLTMASPTRATSETWMLSGKFASTTLLASGDISTDIWPAIGAPRISNETRKAEIPSNKPIAKIWIKSCSSQKISADIGLGGG